VLDMADEIVLLPIYPARELPIEGVSSEMILKRMKNSDKKMIAREQIPGWIKNEFVKNLNKTVGQVLITAGAGDIDTLVQPIKEILEKV